MTMASLIFEALVAVILVAATVSAWRVDRRLSALRAGNDGVVKAAGELMQAAAQAEAGVRALRAASAEAGEALDARVREARALAAELRILVDAGPSDAFAAPRARAPERVPERIAERVPERASERASERPARRAPVADHAGARARDLLETLKVTR